MPKPMTKEAKEVKEPMKVAIYHKAYKYADTAESVATAMEALTLACQTRFAVVPTFTATDWDKAAPGLHQLILSARRGEVDLILCHNLTRLVNASIAGTVLWLQALTRQNIALVFLDHAFPDETTLNLLEGHSKALASVKGKQVVGRLNVEGGLSGRPRRKVGVMGRSQAELDQIILEMRAKENAKGRPTGFSKIAKAIGLPRSTVYLRWRELEGLGNYR